MTATTQADTALAALYADAARFERGEAALPVAAEAPPTGGGETGNGVSDSNGLNPVAVSEATETQDATPQAVETAATPTEPPAAEPPTPAPDKLAADSVPEAGAETPAPTRTEKKQEALARTWENAERRHRDAEAREISLAQREQRLMGEEKRLTQLSQQVATSEDPHPKHSFDDLADSLAGFIDEGDVKLAKQVALGMAAKAKAQVRASAMTPDNPQFVAAWDSTRSQVVKANPELADPQSPLYTAANGLLSGEWGTFFKSNPVGVAAAVEVAKLQLQLGQQQDMAATVKRLETENLTLRKKLRLDGAGSPASREVRPVDYSRMSADDQIALLRREAEAFN